MFRILVIPENDKMAKETKVILHELIHLMQSDTLSEKYKKFSVRDIWNFVADREKMWNSPILLECKNKWNEYLDDLLAFGEPEEIDRFINDLPKNEQGEIIIYSSRYKRPDLIEAKLHQTDDVYTYTMNEEQLRNCERRSGLIINCIREMIINKLSQYNEQDRGIEFEAYAQQYFGPQNFQAFCGDKTPSTEYLLRYQGKKTDISSKVKTEKQELEL